MPGALDPTAVSLAGRVAAITGAGAGIGAGIARAFAAFGAAVVVLERDPATATRTADAIGAAGGTAIAIPVDVRDGDALHAALDATVARFGALHVMVNNAGGTFHQPFLESGEKGWDALLRLNLKTVLAGTQLAARHMAATGHGGSIVNVVTIEAMRAAPGYAAYAAAKAGVVSFTRTAAVELGPHGIRVNALAPDICLTEGLAAMVPAEEQARWPHMIPLGRAGSPDDLAGAAVFLASDLARYVTGVTLHVDGGTHAAGGWWREPADEQWLLGPPRRRA
ncbi:MAG: glucose 1-dehydrogenase [bacterium]|nr:glucose 1-dehydrogenase [bacterium]